MDSIKSVPYGSQLRPRRGDSAGWSHTLGSPRCTHRRRRQTKSGDTAKERWSWYLSESFSKALPQTENHSSVQFLMGFLSGGTLINNVCFVLAVSWKIWFKVMRKVKKVWWTQSPTLHLLSLLLWKLENQQDSQKAFFSLCWLWKKSFNCAFVRFVCIVWTHTLHAVLLCDSFEQHCCQTEPINKERLLRVSLTCSVSDE